jgi:hypothetical protein
MLKCITVMIMLGLVHHGTNAQQDVRGTSAVADGQRYVVGFPSLMPATDERALPRPLAIIITSAYEATVRISTPAVSIDVPRLDRTVSVRPGTSTIVDVPSALLPRSPGATTGYGIELISDRPIAVWTSLAWESNGDVIRHYPVWAWGMKYTTLNYHQDRYGHPSFEFFYRPASFLVIAQEDETVVSYQPTTATEGGSDLQSVPARGIGSVTLQRGETIVVHATINNNATREPSTDLSGTLISSNKPIAVVSGHTKVAVHEMPDAMPPGPGTRFASFVRNCVYESMLPDRCAGKSFITIPTMYTSVRKTGVVMEYFSSGQDRGDVVRIVAIEHNTRISRMRADGSGLRAERTLMRGESYMDTQLESSAYWESDKPVMIAQYGKSWKQRKAARTLLPANP